MSGFRESSTGVAGADTLSELLLMRAELATALSATARLHLRAKQSVEETRDLLGRVNKLSGMSRHVATAFVGAAAFRGVPVREVHMSDIEVLSVVPDYRCVQSHQVTRSPSPAPGASVLERYNTLCACLFPSHASHRMSETASLGGVLAQIRALACRTRVLVLSLLGRDTALGFELLDGDLAPSQIVQCLMSAGFNGTLIFVANSAREACGTRVAPAWGADLPFRWVAITAMGPRDKDRNVPDGAYSDKFMRLFSSLVVQRIRYANVASFVSSFWDPSALGAEDWIRDTEPPVVRMGGEYTGEFAAPATIQRS